MTITQLRYFVKTAELRSITMAAAFFFCHAACLYLTDLYVYLTDRLPSIQFEFENVLVRR